METAELIEIISRGEDSRHQFKADVTNADALAAEMVAFSNSGGGRMFIGVSDANSVTGLSEADIKRLNQSISNAASQNVRPAINPSTENIAHPDGTVLVITIPDGISKPYMDKNGVIWVKSGADKRKATSREEIQRMFQQSGLVYADEAPVRGMGVGDLDTAYFEAFIKEQYGDSQVSQELSAPQLLVNMNLMKGRELNLAGALLFAKSPQFRLPTFIVKAMAYPGAEIVEDRYLDSRDVVGKLADIFQQTVGFILANLANRQGERTINSTGEPEVPRIVWEELVANALVHRDYFISAPVRVFVFANRVEIVSPGHLPNNLTVANILAGNSNIRNPILASFAAKLLPYRGLGTGILRAIRAYPKIKFQDDREGNLFKAIIDRSS